MERLFGTDGIRGRVGKFPLTPPAVLNIGRALGLWLKEQYPPRQTLKVLIGKDTRKTADKLELAFAQGVKQEGLEVLHIGVCPTPALAYLTHTLGAHLGVVISASHNLSSDNGLKFFAADGYKLLPSAESRIEEVFFSLFPKQAKGGLKLEAVKEEQQLLSLYLDFAKNSLGGLDLAGLRVVIDCACGAFSHLAPQLLRQLHAEVLAINNEPDGENININCGTLYPSVMVEKLLEHEADIGIAFDGDGDRVMVADEKGRILDGDYILAILSQHFLKQKRLRNKTIICTQMSNLGLELYLKKLGIRMIRTNVGDKYVLQEMLKRRVNLGGEQSGHVIILERTTTGDGLIVALELIKLMIEAKKRLSEFSKELSRFPQVLVNVRVREKKPFAQIPGLNAVIEHSQQELGQTGRLLVRYSGTENLARVMVEGKKKKLVRRVADSVAGVIRQAVGCQKERHS